jgi:poly-gamma-glutamate system protein
MTGSFPALNIAVLAAAEEMKLKPIAISSVGSSMWGANEPDFVARHGAPAEGEKTLRTSGAASIGGSNDRGRGLSRGRALLRGRSSAMGSSISEPTLEQSIGSACNLCGSGRARRPRLRVYRRVGEHGNAAERRLIKPGISRTLRITTGRSRD